MQIRLSARYCVAVLLATVWLIGGGTAYRALASRYARSPESVALPPGTLARLPLEIEDWRGREVPLDEAIIQATDTDQCLNRLYARRGSRESVALFVAYGVRLRDLMPHRPEVCYPGNGWTLKDRQEVDLRLHDGSTLPCRILRFNHGGLVNRHVTVLNYYIVDGQCSPDVELLRSKIWRPSGGANYVVQVQVTCSGGVRGGLAEEAVQAFGKASAQPIRDLLPGAAIGPRDEDG